MLERRSLPFHYRLFIGIYRLVRFRLSTTIIENSIVLLRRKSINNGTKESMIKLEVIIVLILLRYTMNDHPPSRFWGEMLSWPIKTLSTEIRIDWPVYLHQRFKKKKKFIVNSVVQEETYSERSIVTRMKRPRVQLDGHRNLRWRFRRKRRKSHAKSSRAMMIGKYIYPTSENSLKV